MHWSLTTINTVLTRITFFPPLGNSHPYPVGLFPRQVASALLWRAHKEAPSGLEDQQSSEISFHDYHQASSIYVWWAIIAVLTLFQCVPSSTRVVEMVAASLSSVRKKMKFWQASRVESCFLSNARLKVIWTTLCLSCSADSFDVNRRNSFLTRSRPQSKNGNFQIKDPHLVVVTEPRGGRIRAIKCSQKYNRGKFDSRKPLLVDLKFS